MAIYEHLPDAAESKRLFLNLVKRETMADNRDFDILRCLQAWRESGFDGPWEKAHQPEYTR